MNAPVQAGPAGYVYADVPNRLIAFIIDAIIIGIVGFIVSAVLAGVGLSVATVNPNASGFENLVVFNPVAGLIVALVNAAISAAYFIYTWTAMRASLGQKLLGMQVGNASDGATLTMEQAAKRWIALAAPNAVAQALSGWPGLGILFSLAAFAWAIALLWTTAQSPTKQGLHDQYANTVVVKAARAVA